MVSINKAKLTNCLYCLKQGLKRNQTLMIRIAKLNTLLISLHFDHSGSIIG